MKVLAQSLLLASSLVVGASAMAAPFNGDACVAFSNADLTGQTQVIAPGPYNGVAQTSFTPKSLFVANGHAARIYSQPHYGDEVELIGNAGDLTKPTSLTHLRTTDGGHYVNLAEVWPGASVASLSCVDAGEVVTLPAGSFTDSVVVYNSRTFSIDQFMNIHGNKYTISITNSPANGSPDAKPIAKVRSVQQDSGNGADVVLDLTTGDITVTAVHADQADPSSSQFAKRPAFAYTLDLAYVGAVKVLLPALHASAYNNDVAYPATQFYPESNPELKQVIELLRSYDYSL